MDRGILAGYNAVDISVELYDGSYHDVDSNEMAFKVAGSMATGAVPSAAGTVPSTTFFRSERDCAVFVSDIF